MQENLNQTVHVYRVIISPQIFFFFQNKQKCNTKSCRLIFFRKLKYLLFITLKRKKARIGLTLQALCRKFWRVSQNTWQGSQTLCHGLEPGHTAGGEQLASKGRFICVYNCSPLLTLSYNHNAQCNNNKNKVHNKCSTLESS